jgi:hypothetical protein
MSKLAITESAQNTTVTTVGPVIHDASLEAFTLTSGGQVAVNGVVDTTTSQVILLIYFNHLVYQENQVGNFYSKSISTDAWSAPTGDPRTT